MIFPLKYNTASQEVPLGFFLDSSTGNVEQTSLTINNTDIKLWKSGATSLANKNSGGATHISNGIYYCVLDATDTNTYGPLEIFVHVSGALTFHKVCTVINTNIYDALMSDSTGSIRATVTAMSAGVITSTAIADELFYTADEVAQETWGYSSRTLSGDQSFTLIGNISGSVASVVNGATLTQINSLVSGIRGSDNDSLKTISDQLDSISVSGSTPEAIWSYSSRSLSGDQSFTLIGNISGNLTGSVGSVTGAVGSVTGAVGSVTGAVGSVAGNVSGSVGSVATGGITSSSIATGAIDADALSEDAGTELAAAVWAASSRTLSGNQSFTLIGNVSGNVNGSVGSVVGNVGGNIVGSVASVTGAVGSVAGNVSGSVSSVTGNVAGSVASVVGAVGSVAGNVSGSVGSVSGLTTATITSAVWAGSSRTLSGDQSFTLIGNVSGNVTGSVGSVTTVSDKTGYSLAATQTYTMIGNVSGNVNGSVGSVTGAVGSVAGNVSGSVAAVTGNVAGSVAGSVASVVGAVGSVAGNVSGSVASVTGTVGSVAGNVSGSVGSVIGAVGSVTGAVGSVAGNVSGSVASVTGNVAGSVASVVGAVGSVAGNVSGSVASVVNGATLTQINSLVSSIRGTDNDDLKTLSDQIDGISVSGSTPAEIWSYETRTLTTNIPTVQEIVDGVWDELMVNHTSTGTTGNQLATMGTSSGSITIDPSSIWNYATRTITGGTINTVSGNVNGSVGSVTGSVGSVAGNVSGSVASVTGNVAGSVASVVGAVGSVAGNVSGSVASVTGNVAGSVASVVNGATLTQINSLVSGIRGTDNDSIKTISDQLDGVTPANIWSYSSRTLSGDQSFTLIGNVSGSVGSVTAPVTVGTNNDKTGYSLSATQTFTHIGNVSGNVTGSVGSVTSVADKTGYSLAATQTYTLIGNVSGNVNGSVGSVTGTVGSVAGNVSGSVASVVNGATLTQINSLVSGIRGTDNDSLKTVSDQIDGITISGATAQAIWEYADRTLTSSGTASIDYTQVANAVWDELLSLHTVSGSAGEQLASTVTSSGAVYVNIAEAEIADAVWNALSTNYTITGSMGKALTSTGTAVIDASDVWNYETRTLTTSTGNATLVNQELIIQHLIDIKGDGWTDEDLVAIMTAIEDGTWGGFGV